MKVVMLSRTALASAPYETMKCLNKYTDLEVRWIALKTSYNDGRVFPSDIIYNRNKKECMDIINSADILHIHNEPFPLLPDQLKKKMLVQFHSVPKRPSCQELMKKTRHYYTIKQPLQEFHYSGMNSLPNLIDCYEYKPIKRNIDKLKVVFAPTNKWKVTMAGSKGYEEVQKIIFDFKNDIHFDIFSDLAYTENLLRKQDSDIIIDDIINQTFHRTSLEGCCFGLVVLTNCNKSGFLCTNLATLKNNLYHLIKNRKMVDDLKIKSRQWIENEWNPKEMCKYYVDAYNKVLNNG